MKLRMGFVSNSSSSSFIIMGIEASITDIKELLLQKAAADPKLAGDCEQYYKDNWDGFFENEVDIILSHLFKKKNLKMNVEFHRGHYDYAYDSIYIGISPQQMRDDETLMDLKERVQADLTFMGLNTSIKSMDWIERCWYDG